MLLLLLSITRWTDKCECSTSGCKQKKKSIQREMDVPSNPQGKKHVSWKETEALSFGLRKKCCICFLYEWFFIASQFRTACLNIKSRDKIGSFVIVTCIQERQIFCSHSFSYSQFDLGFAVGTNESKIFSALFRHRFHVRLNKRQAEILPWNA